MRTLFADQGELLDTVGENASSVIGTQQLIERAGRIAEELMDGSSGEIRPLVISLVRRVEISSDAVAIEIYRKRLTSVLVAHGGEPPDADATGNGKPEDIVTLTIAARLQRAGREMRMVVQNANDQRPPDPALLRVLARSHDIQTRLTQNPDLSIHDIARDENVTAAYIYSILRLPWLAPDITDAIVNGRQPPRLTARKLIRLPTHLPIDWSQQRQLLGFAHDKVGA